MVTSASKCSDSIDQCTENIVFLYSNDHDLSCVKLLWLSSVLSGSSMLTLNVTVLKTLNKEAWYTPLLNQILSDYIWLIWIFFFFALKETFFKDSYEQTKPSEWIVLRIPYVAMWGAQGPQSICGNMSSWESPFSLSFCDKQHELLWQLIQVWKYKIKLKMQTPLVRVLSSTPLFIDYLANVPSHGTQMP